MRIIRRLKLPKLVVEEKKYKEYEYSGINMTELNRIVEEYTREMMELCFARSSFEEYVINYQRRRGVR